MSTFLFLKDKTPLVFKSPTSKPEIIGFISQFIKKNKAPPERISFILWEPIDNDFLTGLQVSMEESMEYITRGNLYVHECIETTFGAQVDLAVAPPLEE